MSMSLVGHLVIEQSGCELTMTLCHSSPPPRYQTAPKRAPPSKPKGAQQPRGKGQAVSKQKSSSSSSSEDSSDSSADEKKPASKLKPGEWQEGFFG